jgi:hypothetical protein
MGIDRPDDNVPSDDHSDPPPNRPPAETRYRQDYYTDLRATTTAAQERTELSAPSEPGARSKPNEQTQNPQENGQQAHTGTTWEETAELSRWMWTEYKRRWPAEERPPIDKPDDAPGSWHGDGDRVLESADNQRVEAQCDRIADRERETITPALRETERQDPHRHLVGLKDCLKGRDRIKEKVHDNIVENGLSPDEAVSLVPDAIRYTFQYDEASYTRGIRADIARIKDHGFNLDILKNSWARDQYKGINSQWVDPDTGQRFEVQFHTRISFEAKQLTHGAYERMRTLETDKFEELVLEAFQKKVSAEVPVPPGALDIPDYPKRGTDAR